MVDERIVPVIFWLGAGSFLVLTSLIGIWPKVRAVLWAIPVLTIGLLAACGAWAGVRDFINGLASPEYVLVLSAMLVVLAMIYYRYWTHPLVAGVILVVFSLGYGGSTFDAHFRKIVSQPDHVPITLMIFAMGFVLWLAFRRMAINDRRAEVGTLPAEADGDSQILTWPGLLYLELVAMVIGAAVLIVWAILLRAPLEPPADPAQAPNPAKAPWYFVGLQELLVYFDPWIAGVLLPVLMIVGLCALPYIDTNPKGNGYYTLKQRPFAITVYLLGFTVLWVVPIIIGTFLRGPNWHFFGPYAPWDVHASVPQSSVNLSELFWVRWLGCNLPTAASTGTDYSYLIREAPGLVLLAAYFVLVPLLLRVTVFKARYRRMGQARYAVMMLLLMCMVLVPVKMLLHWWFHLKYLVAIGEWSFNI